MSFFELTGHQLDDPMRRAAVMVYSLADTDQGWLLSKMPPDDQVRLKALMSELAQLKIPTDRRILNQALQSNASNTVDLPTRQVPEQVAQEKTNLEFFVDLEVEDEKKLAMILRREPALLIARLLRIRDWAWRQRILEGLSALQRQVVDDLLAMSPGMQSGTALEDALLRALRSRCEGWTTSMQDDLAEVESNPSYLKASAWLPSWVSRLRGSPQ